MLTSKILHDKSVWFLSLCILCHSRVQINHDLAMQISFDMTLNGYETTFNMYINKYTKFRYKKETNQTSIHQIRNKEMWHYFK